MDEMLDVRAWEGGWSRAWCNVRKVGVIERRRVRRAIASLYHSAGLRAPTRRIWVESPITAAISAAIAGGARWLRRHREVHEPLFGHHLVDNELAHGVRAAAWNLALLATTTFEASPEVEQAADAIVRAASAAAGLHDLGDAVFLPASLRPRLRAVESTTDAPALAAAEGWLDAHLCASTSGLRDAVIAAAERAPSMPDWIWELCRGAGLVTRAIQHAVSLSLLPVTLDDDVATFLTAAAHSYAQRRLALDQAMEDLVPLSYARRRRGFALDYAAWAPLEQLARVATPAFLHADFCIVAERPIAWDPLLRWRDGWAATLFTGDRREDTPRWVLTWPLDSARPWQRVLDVDIDAGGQPMRLLQLGTVGGKGWLVVELTVDGRRRWLRAPPDLRTCRELLTKLRSVLAP